MKILIVDDEEDLCEILQYNLNNEGFATDIAHSAEEALNKPLADYDLILLDVMMGDISGFKFSDMLRKEQMIDTPIIFLTARDTENDMLTGFSLGADDYISKPFSINELMARIKAVLRRAKGEKNNHNGLLKYGDIELDAHHKRLIINDERVELTKKEYEILRLMFNSPGRVFSREEILQKVWGNEVIVTERTVDVNITRIRTKLGEYGSCIKNKTGYGYYFEF